MKVLVVDDDRAVREALGQTLDLAGHKPVLCSSYIEAKDHISPEFDGVVLTDIRMPGKDGFALLEHAHGLDPDLPVILLTGEGDVPMAVRAMAGGAFDFLEKPCAAKDLLSVVEKALKTRALVMENRRLHREIRRGDAAARMLVGSSPVAEALREAARRAARSGAEVLISGAPGAGNSKVAEVIHLLSAAAPRAPAVPSCASSAPKPGPSSTTQNRKASSPSSTTVTRTAPASVNLIALDRILPSARSSASRSTRGIFQR